MLALLFFATVVIALTCGVGYCIFRYVTGRENLDKHDPLSIIGWLLYVAFAMMFFWGILIPPLGGIEIFGLKLWMVGGIGSAIATVIYMSPKGFWR